MKLKKKLEPDFNRFRKTILREGLPDRIPFIEYYIDQPELAKLLGEKPVPHDLNDQNMLEKYYDQRIRYSRDFGLDFIFVGAEWGWQNIKVLQQSEWIEPNKGNRQWVSETTGPIPNREAFEKFPWPKDTDISYRDFEVASKMIPDGMKIVVNSSGPFETVRELMGFETFSIAVMTDPELVFDMFSKTGDVLLRMIATSVEFDNVGAVHMGDDMCYKQGPMISPDMLRQHVFPLQKKAAEIAHGKDLPFTLHSDGRNDILFEDLISNVGIDGKHAYEDAAQPVEEVKQKFGDRVAIVGGMDIDFLCRSDEEALRKRTRSLIEACGQGGGFGFGTGSGVCSYVPLDKYVFMLNEALDVLWY